MRHPGKPGAIKTIVLWRPSIGAKNNFKYAKLRRNRIVSSSFSSGLAVCGGVLKHPFMCTKIREMPIHS